MMSAIAPNPPRHLSKANFDRFAPVIDAAISAYPHGVYVDPTIYGLAPSTAVSRLRDAIASFNLYSWPSCITRADFDRVRDSLICPHLPSGEIVLGRTIEPSPSAPPAPDISGITSIPFDIESIESVEVICILIHAGAINRPVSFTVSELDGATINSFALVYDVTLNKTSTKWIIKEREL